MNTVATTTPMSVHSTRAVARLSEVPGASTAGMMTMAAVTPASRAP